MTADDKAWALVEEASQHGLIASEVVAWARKSPDLDLVDVLEALGGEAVRHGNDRLAEQLYKAALEKGSTLPDVPFNLGNIATRAGRQRQAIEWYSRAIDFDPGLGRSYYNRGLQRRRLGDEQGARADIAAGIERGYDDLDAYAALLRGRSDEFGEPVDAFEQATTARHAFAAGDLDYAITLMELESNIRGRRADRGLQSEIALVIALENERYIREKIGDTGQAATAGAELVRLCQRLANLDDDTWASVPGTLRQFVVDQLPRRLIAMIGLYAQSGRHQDALTAAEEAQTRCRDLESQLPLLGDLSLELANAVYSEIRRRALAAEQATEGTTHTEDTENP